MADLSFGRVVDFASQLIRIPGGSGEEGAVAERVRREMESLGFDEVWIDELGSVIGRVAGRSGGPAVMLSSHLDVVDVGDPSTWEHPPYGGVVADGFLHGRGAMDIKGPLALQCYAAAHFLEDRLDGDVVVAHTVFEERGGWGMQHLLESGRVSPAAVIIGESTGGDICIGHRGRAELVVEVTGRAGHASAPDRALNPLFSLGAVLDALRRFAAELGDTVDPVLGPATLAPTDVSTYPTSRNVIPDQALIIVDWRVLPEWTAERTVAALQGYLDGALTLPEGCAVRVLLSAERQRTYTGVEENRLLFSPGFLLDPEHPVPQAAAQAVASATGRAPRIRPWTFATDGGHTCGEHGIPTIGLAPGEERHAHTNRERLDLEEAARIYAAYPAVIRAIQRAL